MDLSLAILLGLAALIGANQVLVRVPLVRRRAWAFWLIQGVDLLAGVAVLIFGLPGFEHLRPVSWVVGLLLLLHVAQNLHLRGQWEREARAEQKRELEAERERLRETRPPEEA